MNMSLLGDDGGSDAGRYGQFRIGEEELVVFDRENVSAWVRMSPPASLDA